MPDYLFKEWLTFAEAAAWLTDATGKHFSADAITRAVMTARLPAHYWPTDGAEIGVFTLHMQSAAMHEEMPGLKPMAESPTGLDLEQSKIVCLVDGPVPFQQYEFFHSMFHANHVSPIGISAFHDKPELYGCYRIDENDRPVSMTSGSFQTLIHIADMEQLNKNLPLPMPQRPHSLLLESAYVVGIDQRLIRARTSAQWFSYPESSATAEKPESTDKRTGPLLRALGLATHLIAKLGTELDARETVPSHRRGYTRGASPNVAAIARTLAGIAEELRHEGHGFKGDGFQKLLSAALREVD